MKVYKFMSAKWAKEAILSKRLKISIIPTLNDPWEGNALSYTNAKEKEAWELELDFIARRLGMICFSKEWTDPVLWSHYSEQHKGIVLGFEVDHTLMTDVKYRKTLKKYEDFEENISSDTNFVISAISTKYLSWEYEKEVRLFDELRKPDPVSGHFFRDFDSQMQLTDVIFGARYSNHEERMFILASIEVPSEGTIKCWKAALGNKDFQMATDKIWKVTK